MKRQQMLLCLDRLLKIRADSTNTHQESRNDHDRSRVTQRIHHVARHYPHRTPSPIRSGLLMTPTGAHSAMQDTTE